VPWPKKGQVLWGVVVAVQGSGARVMLPHYLGLEAWLPSEETRQEVCKGISKAVFAAPHVTAWPWQHVGDAVNLCWVAHQWTIPPVMHFRGIHENA
jgi:hypothetical protein